MERNSFTAPRWNLSHWRAQKNKSAFHIQYILFNDLIMDTTSNIFKCASILRVGHCIYIKIIQILLISLPRKYYHSHIMDEKNKAQKC